MGPAVDGIQKLIYGWQNSETAKFSNNSQIKIQEKKKKLSLFLTWATRKFKNTYMTYI